MHIKAPSARTISLVSLTLCIALGMGGFDPQLRADGKADADKIAARTAAALYEGIRTATLPNGLRVFLKPIPGAPVVTSMVAYKVGSSDENLDFTGLSHYLEHLMFKGTEKIMPGEIDRRTLRAGGQNNAYTNEDMTNYHFDFSADNWEVALEIEADRMQNLRIDAKHEFEQEKGAVVSELEMDEDQPWDLESKTILPLLFGKGAYGHPVIGERAACSRSHGSRHQVALRCLVPPQQRESRARGRLRPRQGAGQDTVSVRPHSQRQAAAAKARLGDQTRQADS